MNVLNELELANIEYEHAEGDEVRTLCPFHEDSRPSCFVNTKKKCFSCKSCSAEGNMVKYLAKHLGIEYAAMQRQLNERYGDRKDKIIQIETVERYHRQIWSQPNMLKELRDRAVNDELIRYYRIGYNNDRITIPIFNSVGDCVNFRRYLPGAPSSEKMVNSKGRGEMRWYPFEQLSYDTLMICGGEMKAVAAAYQLNTVEIGAVCLTGGEANINPTLLNHLKGKDVIICLDIDSVGVEAMNKWAKLCYRICKSVKTLLLPLDKEKYPTGDINDYLHLGNDVRDIVDSAIKWEPNDATKYSVDEEPESVDLITATSGEYATKRVKVTVDTVAIDNSPYIIPKVVQPECSRDQDFCVMCPLFLDDKPKEISPESPSVMAMVDSTEAVQPRVIGNALGVPWKCDVVKYETLEHYTVEDARISPTLDITSHEQRRNMQPAIIIGGGLELNETYEMIGRMHPHPSTQAATLVISSFKTSNDALSNYKTRKENNLNVFQPSRWTVRSLRKKLNDIYSDFSANITHVNDRLELHLVIDMSYHSPLLFNFDRKRQKGWTDILVIGDSSQGKSEAANSLRKHYGLGEKIECKNATVAGLLGGLQTLNKKWFVTWGVIPTHDRRHVTLEELKGTSTEVISKLTDMRSSGMAEIPKIEKRKTHARTRLLMLSNPRSNRVMASYNFGVNAITELVGSPEDVRRFDFVLVVTQDDVSAEAINKRPIYDHKYESSDCRELILWSWTRKEDQVVFQNEDLILRYANDLTSKFTDRIPLLDRGSTRYKLARLSAALAARTYSTEDGETLLVRNCHVKFVKEFIEKHYSSPGVGYDDFTASIRLTETLTDEQLIVNQIQSVAFPKDLVENLLYADTFDLTDLCDWCNCDRTDGQAILSLFVRKRAIKRPGRKYCKNPPFIDLLKRLSSEGTLKDRPDFIPEEF